MMLVPWSSPGGADPCCCTYCHDKYGATIHSALSGVTLCSGCFTVALADGNVYDVEYSFTGINGTAVPTWDGTNWVAAAVGVGTIKVYSSVDTTCADLIETQTGNLDLTVSCSGVNQMVARVNGIVALASGNINFVAYESISAYTFGTAMPNFRTIAFCGNGGGSVGASLFAAYDGTLTLSP